MDEAKSEIILYQTEDGAMRLEVRRQGGTGFQPVTGKHVRARRSLPSQFPSRHLYPVIRGRDRDASLADSVVKESLTTAANGRQTAFEEAVEKMQRLPPARPKHP